MSTLLSSTVRLWRSRAITRLTFASASSRCTMAIVCRNKRRAFCPRRASSSKLEIILIVTALWVVNTPLTLPPLLTCPSWWQRQLWTIHCMPTLPVQSSVTNTRRLACWRKASTVVSANALILAILSGFHHRRIFLAIRQAETKLREATTLSSLLLLSRPKTRFRAANYSKPTMSRETTQWSRAFLTRMVAWFQAMFSVHWSWSCTCWLPSLPF